MNSEDKAFPFVDCIGTLMVEEDVAPAPTQVSQPSGTNDTVVFHTDTFMILLESYPQGMGAPQATKGRNAI